VDIQDFQTSTFEEAQEYVLSKGLKSLEKDDDDFFCKILMSGCSGLNEKIKLLVSAGVDINAQTPGFPSGFTALSRVTKTAEEPKELIDLLLANGADIEAPSTLGLTPLHCAVILQKLDLMSHLISKGADANAVDQSGESCLLIAINSNDSYKKEQYHWPFCDAPGRTQRPVSIEVLDKLVMAGAKLTHQGGWGGSVLEAAIKTGEIYVIDWLFENGVKPTDVVSQSASKTLLMCACERAVSIDFINHLLRFGARINAVDQDGKTALFYTYDVKIIKKLIQFGASLSHFDKNGRSFFHKTWYDSVVFEKFSKNFVREGGDLDARDSDGRSILHHLASSYSTLGAIKLAISMGCDVNAQDQAGVTPLMLARPDYWDELLSAGARINDVDANGNHALNHHLAAVLIKRGADVNLANNAGQTSLMLASQKGDVPLVKALLKAGAAVGAIDANGKLATDYAAIKALAELMKAGAPVNPDSATILTTAMAGKNASISLLLLKAGLKARLSDVQVKEHSALLETLAQEDLELFRQGVVGKDERAQKLLAKMISDRSHSLEVALANLTSEDEDLPSVLKSGVWPPKAEEPTPHLKLTITTNDRHPVRFCAPPGFDQKMSALQGKLLAEISELSPKEQLKNIKECEKNIIKLCRRNLSKNRSWGYSEFYENKLDIREILLCSDEIILKFWNECFDICSDIIDWYDIKISDKDKYDLILYRIRDGAYVGINPVGKNAKYCLTYFGSAEIAPMMVKANALIWLKRFPHAAVDGLLPGAFSDVQGDRAEAQEFLRLLASQGHRGHIELTAKVYGSEAYAATMTFLDRSRDADFLPQKLPKLPSYFVASAHPAPVLKVSGKALPSHAVETLGRMMLVSNCKLQTPALAKVIEACDRHSLANFVISVYDCWAKNGAKKEGIGFLHALAYMGDTRAAPLLIKTYKNEPFYPATAAAISVLGAIGSNIAITGLLSIVRFSSCSRSLPIAH
jgi:ankyrin repeat protein